MSTPDVPTIDSTDIQAARAAGASDLFLMVASVDPDAVDISRNKVADWTARKADGDGVAEAAGRLEHASERAGDFISALWEGDLAEALYRADILNTKLLVRTFAREVLLGVLAAERGGRESAERWLDPVIERYGWGSDE